MMRRFANRIMHLKTAQALRGWMIFVDIRQALRLRLRGAVFRWKDAMQAVGFRTWQEFNACKAREEDAERHKAARMRSILLHMRYRSLSRCMLRWQDLVRIIRLKRKVGAKILHLKISVALQRWINFVDVRRALRHRITVALHRWKHAMQYAGFQIWCKFSVSMARTEERSRSRIAHEVELERYQDVHSRLSDALMKLNKIRSKLANCEAERRGLHEAVEWYKQELEEVGKTGKKWQDIARALDSQHIVPGDIASLRLQYATLLRTHQELCAQVDSIMWREGLLESENTTQSSSD